jgi:predicted nucleic-acid-binding Zn-ribbon protein
MHENARCHSDRSRIPTHSTIMTFATPCTNCQSEDLYETDVSGGGTTGSLLPLGAFHGPRYRIVVCGECGHTRWFVSKEHLHLVKEKLSPVVKD